MALDELPFVYREVMTLRFEEEMKIEEIAQVLERPAFHREIAAATFARADAKQLWKPAMPGRIGDEATSSDMSKNMSKTEHNKIREMLALAAADGLEAERIGTGDASRADMRCNVRPRWSNGSFYLAGLRQLPTPQPSADLVQRTCARAEARVIEEHENAWNRRVMISLVRLPGR